ncbi:MAG: insulinase family protein, partial [Nanoarchaeota archaeon]|nr:insulinase family protein [Nanoarchaeota archaeon]
ETMNSIDRKKIVETFERIYQSNNMVLCVVGDADFDYLVKFVEKNFGTKKGKINHLKIELHNETKIVKRKGIDQANLVFAYHVPLSTDKKSYAAQILSTLMGGGLSSRLFSEIREKRNMAYAVKSMVDINKYYAFDRVYVGTTKENVEKVKELILEEYKKVAESLTEKELNQVKEQLIGHYYISSEDSELQMRGLLYTEMNGDARNFYKFVENIKEVKLKDVKDLAKIKKYSFFALIPE